MGVLMRGNISVVLLMEPMICVAPEEVVLRMLVAKLVILQQNLVASIGLVVRFQIHANIASHPMFTRRCGAPVSIALQAAVAVEAEVEPHMVRSSAASGPM